MEDFRELEGDPNFMRSLARGLLVITAFADRKTPMTIAELARITKLDRSVVRRCLYTLTQLGFAQTHGSRFSLDPSILQLGHSYFSSSRLVEASQPYLDQLGNSIYTNCALAIMSNHEVVYLSRFQSKRLIQKHIGLGSRLPAYCTSVGRVLLAMLDADEIDTYLDRETLRPYTEYTVFEKGQLKELIKNTAEDGFCILDQEIELGMAAIAVPVKMDAGQTSMALSVTVNTKFVAANQLRDMYLHEMTQLASKLSTL